MSAGSQIITGAIDILESAADVAPVGTTRIRRKGGALQSSADGGAYSTLGGGGAGASYVTTLGAPATNLSVAGLLPATDGDYDLYAALIIGQANATIKFQPNGADTNCTSLTGNLLQGAVTRADFSLAKFGVSPYTFAVGNTVVVEGRIFAKAGRIRGMRLSWTLLAAGAVSDAGSMNGIYNDSATALTSINVVSIANGLDTASFVRLTGVPQTA